MYIYTNSHLKFRPLFQGGFYDFHTPFCRKPQRIQLKNYPILLGQLFLFFMVIVLVFYCNTLKAGTLCTVYVDNIVASQPDGVLYKCWLGELLMTWWIVPTSTNFRECSDLDRAGPILEWENLQFSCNEYRIYSYKWTSIFVEEKFFSFQALWGKWSYLGQKSSKDIVWKL